MNGQDIKDRRRCVRQSREKAFIAAMNEAGDAFVRYGGDEPDDDGNMMVGNGATEHEAISDLLEQLEERV